MGMPADMEQAVAVSDSMSRPEHPWSYSWANPDDEAKMKSALEEIARAALGLNTPAPATRRATAQKKQRTKPPSRCRRPSRQRSLDEHFRVFELAYGSGATLVLSAHTDGPFAQQKFVTLIAQPDLYGNVLVLLKNVTDGAHLDDTPRMRLVDAVDALADNRGELLFELRGETQRQFALYRVFRGQAQKLFVTAASPYETETHQIGAGEVDRGSFARSPREPVCCGEHEIISSRDPERRLSARIGIGRNRKGTQAMISIASALRNAALCSSVCLGAFAGSLPE